MKAPQDHDWRGNFIRYCKSPERFPFDPADPKMEKRTEGCLNCVIKYDTEFVFIKDGMPKSSLHYVIMPRKIILTFKDIKVEDMVLIRRMQVRAEQFLDEIGEDKSQFRFGFHAVPTMPQVHMHVISQDFQEDENRILEKEKKHWQTFNTPFFVQPQTLIKLLENKNFAEILKLKEHKKTDPKCGGLSANRNECGQLDTVENLVKYHRECRKRQSDEECRKRQIEKDAEERLE